MTRQKKCLSFAFIPFTRENGKAVRYVGQAFAKPFAIAMFRRKGIHQCIAVERMTKAGSERRYRRRGLPRATHMRVKTQRSEAASKGNLQRLLKHCVGQTVYGRDQLWVFLTSLLHRLQPRTRPQVATTQHKHALWSKRHLLGCIFFKKFRLKKNGKI